MYISVSAIDLGLPGPPGPHSAIDQGEKSNVDRQRVRVESENPKSKGSPGA